MTIGVGPSPRQPVDPTRDADVVPVRILSRPQGIRPRDAPLPKGAGGQNVVAILTGSNYQVDSRVWIDAGRELALRVIVDTGLCVCLVREALLPPEMEVAPLDAATAQLFDVNGGLLPITGTVTLTVRVGTYQGLSGYGFWAVEGYGYTPILRI